MALPDFFKQIQGSAITWKESGGTHIVNLNNVTNNAGAHGNSHNFTADFAHKVIVEVTAYLNTNAITAGDAIHIHWCPSTDDSFFPGALASAAAAYTGANYNAEQGSLQIPHLFTFPMANITGIQKMSQAFVLPAQYGKPLVFNEAGTNLAANATFIISITPVDAEVTDTQ